MGWAVLYIAFGVVALWLLGEVLLQYKARLRWRLLAFTGFLGVVAGVLIPSVPVIGAGAITFAVGQTYVTLSFRRGFAAGWALRGVPGLSRGEDEDAPPPVDADPTLQVSDLEAVPMAAPEPPAYQPEPLAYQPEPLPDDTGEYGVYGDSAAHAAQSAPGAGVGGYGGYETYGGYGTTDGRDVYADAAQGHSNGQDVYADAGQYGYGAGAYAGYTDPYGGSQQPGYDQQGGQQYGDQHQQYADQYAAYGQDQYGGGDALSDHYAAEPSYGGQQQYAPDAGMQPGGGWVPQQRDGDGGLPQDQSQYPYQQQDYNNGGYDERYRY
ncbi:hypothetical protein B7755_010575 [Streptomyces sp. NBS 14/10]|uniref:hypothetical protein n=1 Tax=Streptomyces sp. NBS 14/10 TaxID=1945643 RepID=UPI000B7C66E1|nr:hypothetical protein [Streptomyces sp. NBS 14/10]KAK1178540.1 hypothetical protein B7755_010575 [Streptomyces sp. NBS 14/10]